QPPIGRASAGQITDPFFDKSPGDGAERAHQPDRSNHWSGGTVELFPTYRFVSFLRTVGQGATEHGSGSSRGRSAINQRLNRARASVVTDMPAKSRDSSADEETPI